MAGILSDDGTTCCLEACGQCGGSGCGDVEGTCEKRWDGLARRGLAFRAGFSRCVTSCSTSVLLGSPFSFPPHPPLSLYLSSFVS